MIRDLPQKLIDMMPDIWDNVMQFKMRYGHEPTEIVLAPEFKADYRTIMGMNVHTDPMVPNGCAYLTDNRWCWNQGGGSDG